MGMEYEYSLDFLDIQEGLAKQLKTNFKFFMQKFVVNKCNSKLEKPTQHRKLLYYSSPKYIAGTTPLVRVISQAKVLHNVKTLFMTANHDLIPYIEKTAEEYEIPEAREPVDNELTNVVNRWYDYIEYRGSKIRVSVDKLDHYTRVVMWSVNVELECDEFNDADRQKFCDFICDAQRFPLNQLLNDLKHKPLNLANFLEKPIVRPFIASNPKIDVNDFTRFSYKLDGERTMGILSSTGLFYFYSKGVGQIHTMLPIHQLYLVTLELLHVGTDNIIPIIVDVNSVIRFKYNLNVDIAKSHTMLEYNMSHYDIPIIESINYMTSILSTHLTCNKYFHSLQEMKNDSSMLVYPTDGYLGFSNKAICKFKQQHTIELKFNLQEMIKSWLEKEIYYTKRGTKKTKCRVKSFVDVKRLKLPIVSIHDINKVPADLYNQVNFLYTAENKSILLLYPTIEFDMGNIDFFSNLLITPDSEVLNNVKIVEFIVSKKRDNDGIVLKLHRFRNDKYHADSEKKIRDIFKWAI